jgi:SNF2 family DNA or RNA helicase
MTLKHRPYQLDMAEFLGNTPRAALLGRMGSGKTTSGLTALDWMSNFEDMFPALVIAPRRVAGYVWTDEARLWTPHLRVSTIVGTPEQRVAAMKASAEIYTVNYENIPWLRETLGNRWPFKTVICDEASKLRSFRLQQGGVRAQALKATQHLPKFWWNLAGSPSANGLHHLWGQYWFLDRGERLGQSYSAFEDRWFKTPKNGFGLEPFPHTHDEIVSRIKDITFAFDPRKYFDIRDPIEHEVKFSLPAKAQAAYDDMEKLLYVELSKGKKVEVFSAGGKTMKCLQIASGVLYDGESAEERSWVPLHDEKLEALESIVEETEGEPLLVAYHFKSDAVRIKERFKQARVLDDKKQTEDDWNAGKIPMLLVQPASAGHGLNLQHGGRTIVFYTPWWDLELHEQVIERLGPTRQFQSGYERDVHIYYLLANRTVDGTVRKRLQTKESMQALLYRDLQERHR